jgi:hypothetical protein
MVWNPPELRNFRFAELSVALAALIVAAFVSLVAARAWGHIMVHPIEPAGVGASTPAGGWALALPGGLALALAGGLAWVLAGGLAAGTPPALRLERPG